MATYRSAMGKSVDMSAMAAKNEKVRAVGNVKNLNARGDTIDSLGRVIQSATDKVSNSYGKTVGNRSSYVTKPQNKIQPDVPKPTKIEVEKVIPEELLPEELELEESVDDIEIEKIKEEETKKATKKK
jgi:hypothetical protein